MFFDAGGPEGRKGVLRVPFLAGGYQQWSLEVLRGALATGIERTQPFQFIAVKLRSAGRAAIRIYIQNEATTGEATGVFNGVRSSVAQADQSFFQRLGVHDHSAMKRKAMRGDPCR